MGGYKQRMKGHIIHTTLATELVSRTGLLWDAALVLGFSCITAVCAQVSFWIGTVPVTGQTFAVLLSGALLGSRRGALSQLAYIAIGATGIPYWFALGGPLGIARLAGPTGGYLIGFILAAFIVGWLAERNWDKRVWTMIAAMLVGSAAYFVSGLAWLAHFVPEGMVLKAGLYPFIIGDLAKLLAAALIVPIGWTIAGKLRH
jgi:biotin transporter BioY